MTIYLKISYTVSTVKYRNFVVLRVILRRTSTRLRAETGKEVKSRVKLKTLGEKKNFEVK